MNVLTVIHRRWSFTDLSSLDTCGNETTSPDQVLQRPADERRTRGQKGSSDGLGVHQSHGPCSRCSSLLHDFSPFLPVPTVHAVILWKWSTV